MAKKKVYMITLKSGELPARITGGAISKEGKGSSLRVAVSNGLTAIFNDPRMRRVRVKNGQVVFSFVGTEASRKDGAK